MTRSWRLGLSIGTIVIAILVLRSPWFAFQTIKWFEPVRRGWGSEAAAQLRSSPTGVRLALDDMSYRGGRTRGWSSWILSTTPLRDQAIQGLRKIAADPSEPSGRRVEAHTILWRITEEPMWLRELADIALHGEQEWIVRYAQENLALIFRACAMKAAEGDGPAERTSDAIQAVLWSPGRTNTPLHADVEVTAQQYDEAIRWIEEHQGVLAYEQAREQEIGVTHEK